MDALLAGGTWHWPDCLIDWRFEPWPGEVPDEAVFSVRIVPFVGDDCVLIRLEGGRLDVPGGRREPGEAWTNAAIRELVEEVGAKLLTLHPFGAFRCHARGKRPPRLAPHLPYPDFTWVAAWADVALTGAPTNPPDAEQVVEVLVVPPDEAARLLSGPGGWGPEWADLYLLAAERRAAGVPEPQWYRDVTRLLENAYLAAPDVYAQSGKGGGSWAEWEFSRRIVAEAVEYDGSFLDTCCANGLLMESVERWAAEKGVRVEPYGLDISARLVDLARNRLPRWRDRFFVGNAVSWRPPRRFDVVYTLLDIVPEHRRRDLVAHLLADVVAPGGRLAVGQYLSRHNGDTHLPPVGDVLRGLGFAVAGEAEQDRGERGPVRVAWIDAPR